MLGMTVYLVPLARRIRAEERIMRSSFADY